MIKKYLIIAVLFSFITISSNEVFSPCPMAPYSIYYGVSTSKLCVSCTGSKESLSLKMIDPVTLNQEKSYPMDGLVDEVIPIKHGTELLVLLSEIDSDEGTQDGVLRKIDAKTGAIINELLYPQQFPCGMVVDHNEEYVFVTSGVDNRIEALPCIKKINIDSFAIINNAIFGEMCDVVEISNDNSRIYVGNSEAYGGGIGVTKQGQEIETPIYYTIGVFNTSDLSGAGLIKLDFPPFSLEMGNNDRLYVGIDEPRFYNGPAMLVVNTQSNEIIKTLGFDKTGDIGILFMSFNPNRNELYCTTTFGRTSYPDVSYIATNQILKLDLNDYSFEFVNLGFEPLWETELAFGNGLNRLFCIAKRSNRIYYLDI